MRARFGGPAALASDGLERVDRWVRSSDAERIRGSRWALLGRSTYPRVRYHRHSRSCDHPAIVVGASDSYHLRRAFDCTPFSRDYGGSEPCILAQMAPLDRFPRGSLP